MSTAHLFRMSIKSSSSSCSAASAPPRCITREEQECEYPESLALGAPTSAQLHALTAIPLGMVRLNVNRKRGKRAKRSPLAKEAQIISKLYNAAGSRPYPVNNLNLEQSVQLELMFTSSNVLSSSTTIGVINFYALAFTVNQFSGATNLISVFDQYRFDQIEVWISSPNAVSGIAFPILASAIDLDDANVPSVLGDVIDHQGAILADGPGGHYHRWKPHMATAAFSGTFTSYSNDVATWIDSASPSVEHYGIKIAAQSTGSTAVSFDLVVRAVVSFRAPSIH